MAAIGIKKDSDSPGFLAEEPQVRKTNKNILAVIMLMVVGLVAVLLFGLTAGDQGRGRDEAGSELLEGERKPLSAPIDGKGLALEPAALPKAPGEAPRDKPLTVVGPPPVDREAEARRREEEEIRRRKFERDQQAFSSQILVRRERDTVNRRPETAEEAAGRPESDDRTGAGSAYDPAADRDKEAFFVRADGRNWLSPYTREAGRKFELKTGTVIPGTMVSGINSDLPGSLIAQVSQNVYDTATGRHLLLPQGSKLYGVYDSRVVYGQERVLIAWNRVIFPDGSSVTLGAMPGADISGYAGFTDQVNNHYFRIFGSAVIMSLITGGMGYALDQAANTGTGGGSSPATLQDEMVSALAAQLGQTTLELLRKNLNLKPTLEIRPGYQFNVIVTKDVVFREPYAAR